MTKDLPSDGFGSGPFVDLVRMTPAMMLLTDDQGCILSASPALVRRLGLAEDSLAGRRLSDLLHETDALPEHIDTGDRIDALPLDLRGPHGVPVPVLATASPLAASNGGAPGRLLVLADAGRLRETEAKLKRAVLEATEASRAKSRFLAAMSHEVRTPMNAILGFAQLLKLSELDSRARGHVEAILSAGGVLMTLLTDLLDLSQVEAGRLRIDPRTFRLVPMLHLVADWWRSSAAAKGLSLTVESPEGLPEQVIADPLRLQQILNNFLSNAIKYSGQGSVTLRVIQIQRTPLSAVLRFEVEDTGTGMDEAQQERLFLPFIRVESDFGKESGGWGLGLSICRSIADTMQARIGVRSAPGQGSVFHVELEVGLPTTL